MAAKPKRVSVFLSLKIDLLGISTELQARSGFYTRPSEAAGPNFWPIIQKS